MLDQKVHLLRNRSQWSLAMGKGRTVVVCFKMLSVGTNRATQLSRLPTKNKSAFKVFPLARVESAGATGTEWRCLLSKSNGLLQEVRRCAWWVFLLVSTLQKGPFGCESFGGLQQPGGGGVLSWFHFKNLGAKDTPPKTCTGAPQGLGE